MRFGNLSSHAMACWSTWIPWAPKRHVKPPSVVSIRGTPATKTRSAFSGVTHTRPNHQPKLDCEFSSKGLGGLFVHESPPVSYTHLRAHETDSYLVCRLL